MTAALQKYVLTMNRGSATLKSALYDAANRNTLLITILVDQPAGCSGTLKILGTGGATLLDESIDASAPPETALQLIVAWLRENNFLSRLAAAGHRLVQGGDRYTDPQRLSPEILSDLDQLVPLDPDHLPAALRGIRYIAQQFPDLPQVACFDTAFHRSLPTVARMYALPRRFYDLGIRRYGFHGLSYEFIMSELRTLDEKRASSRVIIAHLGSGASIVAVNNGKSVDTSMGFTPLAGLVMSTRSGDVDPGLLLYLLEHKNISAKELDKLLNKQSGLLGVSGKSGDMRALLEKGSEDPHATEAIDLFCYRAKKYIGAYAAALGGVDVLVFAGGIGEHAPAIRNRICEGLDFLGIQIDARANETNAALISPSESAVSVRVIKTNEDLTIVRHVCSVLGWKGG